MSELTAIDMGMGLMMAIQNVQDENKTLEAQMQANLHYTDLAKTLAASSDAIPLEDFARLARKAGIDMRQRQLLLWLWACGYITADGEPYQRYIDHGLFSVETIYINTVLGGINKTTMLVTGYGQIVLLNALWSEQDGTGADCGLICWRAH